MKTVKNSRQELILKLIKEKNISTQDELTKLVREAGYDATQATCSRDNKELGIIKITMPNNESLHFADVVGTIAGDDTIFIATEGVEEALAMIVTIKDMIGGAQS